MSYDTNPYYSPEHFDPPLKLEAELSLDDEAYQFDIRIVVSDERGNLYTARDSGCSCPCPFEDFHSLSDFVPLGLVSRRRIPTEGEDGYENYHRAQANGWDVTPWFVQERESFDALIREAEHTQPSATDRFYGTPPSIDSVRDYIKVIRKLKRRYQRKARKR